MVFLYWKSHDFLFPIYSKQFDIRIYWFVLYNTTETVMEHKSPQARVRNGLDAPTTAQKRAPLMVVRCQSQTELRLAASFAPLSCFAACLQQLSSPLLPPVAAASLSRPSLCSSLLAKQHHYYYSTVAGGEVARESALCLWWLSSA